MTALNARTRIAFIAEVTENTTPATPAFQVIRATGESIMVERNFGFSSELDGRRGQKSPAVNSSGASGAVETEWSDGTFETWLESLLRGAWATDVLVDADTPKSLTLEVTFEDGATDVYKRATGCHASSVTITANAGERVTASWQFVGRGGDFANAAIAGATYTAGNDEPVEVGAGVTGFVMSGITVGCVPRLALQINNNLNPEYCLGSLGPTHISPGALEVTCAGQMRLSASQYDMLRAYADGTETSLEFDIGTDSGHITHFSTPATLIEKLDVKTTSPDGSVLIDFTMRAIQSSDLSGSVIEISRNQ